MTPDLSSNTGGLMSSQTVRFGFNATVFWLYCSV